MKAIRTQVDDLGDLYSDESAISFDPAEDKTRQEFKAESDINTLMKRYGADRAVQLPYGDVDYDTDLRSAYAAAQDAQDVFQRLPLSVRKHFPSWYHLAQHLASIGFTIPEPKATEVSSGAAGSSQPEGGSNA